MKLNEVRSVSDRVRRRRRQAQCGQEGRRSGSAAIWRRQSEPRELLQSISACLENRLQKFSLVTIIWPAILSLAP